MLNEMEHWPAYTTPNEKPYTLKHAQLLEKTLGCCKSFRTAVQAGGSIGYWPRRMAEKFDRVITFEPEPMMFHCLRRNLAGLANITVNPGALGEHRGRCAIERLSFGSHFVKEGDETDIVPLDQLRLDDLDLLQLDIEGYELFALKGAARTIERCRPVIQVEAKNSEAYEGIRALLDLWRYRPATRLGARDYVFIAK